MEHEIKRVKHEVNFDFYMPNKFIAWLHIGRWIWVLLGIGWLVLIFSILNGFEIPAAGAVLVCVSLISDAVLRATSWGVLRNINYIGHFKLSRHVHGGIFFFTDGFKIPANKQTLSLYAISDTAEELWQYKEVNWRATKTAMRADRVISKFIAFSAVAGTLLWGYGHLHF